MWSLLVGLWIWPRGSLMTHVLYSFVWRGLYSYFCSLNRPFKQFQQKLECEICRCQVDIQEKYKRWWSMIHSASSTVLPKICLVFKEYVCIASFLTDGQIWIITTNCNWESAKWINTSSLQDGTQKWFIRPVHTPGRRDFRFILKSWDGRTEGQLVWK